LPAVLPGAGLAKRGRNQTQVKDRLHARFIWPSDDGAFLNRKSCIMGNLVFLRRSDAYRHAAAAALRHARATPPGSERTEARVLARGLMELARTEAWLEGKRFRRAGVIASDLSAEAERAKAKQSGIFPRR
jgi:hypothetical protein